MMPTWSPVATKFVTKLWSIYGFITQWKWLAYCDMKQKATEITEPVQ